MADEATKRSAQEYLATRLSEDGLTRDETLNREAAIALAPAVWKHLKDTVVEKCLEWNAVTQEQTLVDGVPILPKGSHVTGVITAVEPKKRFGHLGKLAFSITSIRLSDGNLASVRCYQQFLGSSFNSPETALPVYPGRDAVVLKDAEFTVFVSGDLPLKREDFAVSKEPPASGSGSLSQTPQR